MSDPLDESDYRTRHFPGGEHLYRNDCGRWHTWASRQCANRNHIAGRGYALAWWERIARQFGPLTFCDCEDATIEAENGATD